MNKRLILIRHMDKHEPIEGALYGQVDLPLREGVYEKFKPVKVGLEELQVDALICSPLQRCRKTCEYYFPNLEPVIRDEAMEVDFGDWEGLTFDQIKGRYPEEVNHWAADESFSFPKGESLKAFNKRIKVLLTDICSLDKKNVVLVTHGGVIRIILCQLLDLHQKHSSAFRLDAGTLTCVEVFENGLGVLEKLNDFGDKRWLKSLS